jgi:ubiquinone/menaquinone biosynthesis C-methylase UbiE
MKTEYYREIGKYYDKDACNYDSRYWENPVVQQIRQSFREVTKLYPGKTMLEIGCGTGLDLIHFGRTHPDRKIFGVDVSHEMVQKSNEKIIQSGCNNISVKVGSVEDLTALFPNLKFDIIYIFFGALNTVENLKVVATNLKKSLNGSGVIVISFVNKWYLGGMVLELIRFHFSKAFARLKPVWGGYSPQYFVPGRCYTRAEIKNEFKELKIINKKGYSIVHPAWYFTGINKRLGKLRRILWKIDNLLEKTFLWRFSEYGLYVFQS